MIPYMPWLFGFKIKKCLWIFLKTRTKKKQTTSKLTNQKPNEWEKELINEEGKFTDDINVVMVVRLE